MLTLILFSWTAETPKVKQAGLDLPASTDNVWQRCYVKLVMLFIEHENLVQDVTAGRPHFPWNQIKMANNNRQLDMILKMFCITPK